MEKHKFNGSSNVFRELIGKTINEFHLNENRDELFFKTGTDEWLRYQACGDCRSKSWFEHVDSPSNEAMKVFEVLEREMPEGLSNDTWDYLQFYGWSLVTDRGYFDIEMRNSSNGFYNGEVEFIGKDSPESVKKLFKEEAEKKAEKERKLDQITLKIISKMKNVIP